MKKPVCMFCDAPATLLCDGIIGWDADEDELGHMTKCRGMFTCDAPVCRNCATWHGNIFFDGKIRMMDTRDLCPPVPEVTRSRQIHTRCRPPEKLRPAATLPY